MTFSTTYLPPKELVKAIKKARKIVVRHNMGPNTSIYHEVKKSVILEAFKTIAENAYGIKTDLFSVSTNENNTLYINGAYEDKGQ